MAEKFEDIWPAVASLTVSPQHRCRALWQAATVLGVPGQIAEVGVYRGGTLLLLAAAFPSRRVFGFDTFGGMPDRTTPGLDIHKTGDFEWTSLAGVRRNLEKYPNVVLVPGIFPDSALALDYRPIPGMSDAPFAFVHFDGDLYQSCKDAITFFWQRLLPGGLMVFDDYKWPNCPGVEKAIAEAGLKVSPLPGGEYQAVAVKE